MPSENAVTTPYPGTITPIKMSQKHRSLWGDAARRFLKNRLALVGLLILAFLFLTALLADLIAPYPYDKVNFAIVSLLPFKDPNHILGGDGVGRDYLTRLIYGIRTSIMVGLAVPFIGFTIGVSLGTLSGYQGGKVDFIIQRIVEIFTAVPPLMVTLFLLSITGSGVQNVIFVLGVTSWIEPTRLTRAQFLTFREKDYVSAARATGASDLRIILSHMLPNILTPLLVAFTFAVPYAIFAEAGLSFLGIGITEPTASLGKMVGGAIGNSIRVYYHLALFPTLLVALIMLGFSFVGDGLQEALDPSRSR